MKLDVILILSTWNTKHIHKTKEIYEKIKHETNQEWQRYIIPTAGRVKAVQGTSTPEHDKPG